MGMDDGGKYGIVNRIVQPQADKLPEVPDVAIVLFGFSDTRRSAVKNGGCRA